MGVRVGVTVLSFETVMREVVRDGAVDPSLFDYARFAKRAAESGFDHLELSLDAYYALPGALSKACVKSLKELGEEYNVKFSAHLPLWSIEPASHIEEIREASVSAVLKPVFEVEELEPNPYVLHATGSLAAEFHRLKIDSAYRKMITGTFLKNAEKSVGEIVERMSEIGVEPKRIALESVEFPFLDTLKLAEEFEASVCIDTGHILAGGPGDVGLKDAMTLSAGRIGEVHLHDAYRRVDGECIKVKDHLPLGAGDLNVDEFLDLLRSSSFEGPIVFELSLEEALASLRVLRKRKQ